MPRDRRDPRKRGKRTRCLAHSVFKAHKLEDLLLPIGLDAKHEEEQSAKN